MTNDHDVKMLSDELHGLADDLAPSSSAARDRARRGIARHTRNRRAAMGSVAAVVAIATTAIIAVAREPGAARRPSATTPSVIGTTVPEVTTPTTTVAPASGSPERSRIPPIGDLTAMRSSYAKTFAWGTQNDQVAFQVPHGEGVSGGPIAFEADAAGNIVMLDQSNSRVVHFEQHSYPAEHLALASPGVTAAAFDQYGHLVVATVTDLAVFGPQGQAEGSWTGISKTSITSLEVAGRRVYSVDRYRTRTLLLRDDGSGYVAVRGAAPETTSISVAVRGLDVWISVSANGTEYHLTNTVAHTEVRAVKLLPDGSLVFVLAFAQHGLTNPDAPLTYVVGRIDREGHARYQTVAVPTGYLLSPGFVLNNYGLAVMGSTAAGGVTVTYYPYN